MKYILINASNIIFLTSIIVVCNMMMIILINLENLRRNFLNFFNNFCHFLYILLLISLILDLIHIDLFLDSSRNSFSFKKLFDLTWSRLKFLLIIFNFSNRILTTIRGIEFEYFFTGINKFLGYSISLKIFWIVFILVNFLWITFILVNFLWIRIILLDFLWVWIQRLLNHWFFVLWSTFWIPLRRYNLQRRRVYMVVGLNMRLIFRVWREFMS